MRLNEVLTMRRTIQERIEDKLAEGMLDGVVKDGDTARFVMKDNEPVLESVPQSARIPDPQQTPVPGPQSAQ